MATLPAKARVAVMLLIALAGAILLAAAALVVGALTTFEGLGLSTIWAGVLPGLVVGAIVLLAAAGLVLRYRAVYVLSLGMCIVFAFISVGQAGVGDLGFGVYYVALGTGFAGAGLLLFAEWRYFLRRPP